MGWVGGWGGKGDTFQDHCNKFSVCVKSSKECKSNRKGKGEETAQQPVQRFPTCFSLPTPQTLSKPTKETWLSGLERKLLPGKSAGDKKAAATAAAATATAAATAASSSGVRQMSIMDFVKKKKEAALATRVAGFQQARGLKKKKRKRKEPLRLRITYGKSQKSDLTCVK